MRIKSKCRGTPYVWDLQADGMWTCRRCDRRGKPVNDQVGEGVNQDAAFEDLQVQIKNTAFR